MTVSASIPAAVMTVARRSACCAQRGTILEANLSQTVASASTSLATGTIFTIPALFLWGAIPPYLQVVALAFLGALLGLAAMIPLRRLLIVKAHDELPYPEGTACAEVLRATSARIERRGEASAWIFRGMAVGAAIKLVISLLFLLPGEIARRACRCCRKRELALELAPALLGVGLHPRLPAVGRLRRGRADLGARAHAADRLDRRGLTQPLYPETQRLIADMNAGDIWSRYVRYIGAGAVATAGIITVLRGLPTMAGCVHGRRARHAAATARRGGAARRAPIATCPAASCSAASRLVILVAGLVPGVFAGNMAPLQRAISPRGVGVFGVLFVAVAARIVGIVGVSSQPTSGIALVTLLGTASIFAAAGWTDPARAPAC